MWRPLNSLTFRLTGTLIIVIVAVFAIVAAVQVQLQQYYGRSCARINGLALTEGLYGALHSTMLANDREELRESVRQITERSPNLRIRIFNKGGEIVFSSRPEEVGQLLDMKAEECYQCHKANQPIERLPPGDRVRSFHLGGHPAIGIIKPIRNEPACGGSGCHASPTEQRLLGVLDTTLLMTPAEEARRRTTQLMIAASAVALLLVVGAVVVVVRRAVRRPVGGLTRALDALAGGDYAARFDEPHIIEFSRLGKSLNHMARELERANAELLNWAQTLERRVEEKTAALGRAHERVQRAERLAALGKLAAVVAHEINNPLGSVLTYAKLLRRRLAQLSPSESRAIGGEEAAEILDAIATESARCGDIVANLLSFARGTGARRGPGDVNQAIERALFLIRNKLEVAGVRTAMDLCGELPEVGCNGDQLQQAFLALFVNAVEAMPEGGEIRVITHVPERGWVEAIVSDTGHGISPEVRAQMFEPFFTTKDGEDAKGLGLGLSVVDSIVQEHHGTIAVDEEPGGGTRFVLRLPVELNAASSSSDRTATRADGAEAG